MFTAFVALLSSSSTVLNVPLTSNEILTELDPSIDLREHIPNNLAGEQVDINVNAENSIGEGPFSDTIQYTVPGISSSSKSCV